MIRYVVITLCLLLTMYSLSAQQLLGMSGGLTVPAATMREAGMFRMGGNFLPEPINPDRMDYNTGNYFFDLTFFRFLELSYRSTLMRVKDPFDKTAVKWNRDRSVGVRLQVLKENGGWFGNRGLSEDKAASENKGLSRKSWIPSLAIGSTDILTTGKRSNHFTNEKSNLYYASIYLVADKQFCLGTPGTSQEGSRCSDTYGPGSNSLGTHRLGFTLGYYLPLYHRSRYTGIFGGIWYAPFSDDLLRVYAEYDGKGVALGARVMLWKQLEAYALCYRFEGVAAGISWGINLFDIRERRRK